MRVSDFGGIETELLRRVERIVWCTTATQMPDGRLRSRILHPIWEGARAWVATGRHSPKEADLTANHYLSLSYWDPAHEQVYAECISRWEESAEEKARVWRLFGDAPAPMGYDLGLFWPAGPSDPSYGLLELSPWRIELSSLAGLIAGRPSLVWQPAGDPPLNARANGG